MELETTATAPETTAQEAPSAPNSAPEAASTPEAKSDPTGLESLKTAPKMMTEEAVKAVKEAYNPNYKFKAYQKEYEIDEWARPYIKDEETEKKFKKLYERAYGYDFKAQKHDELKSEYEKIRDNYDETDKALKTLSGYVQENDFDSFFDGLNIPKNKVLEYALELVKREQMSPDQRQQWEANQQARHAAKYYQAQNEQLLANQQAFAVQQRTFELDNALQSAEAKPIVEAYNVGMGSPEAFKEYVIQIGQSFAARGQDISAQQAVGEAMKHLKAINPSLGVQVASQPPVVTPSTKPTIPNIQGRGTSAVKTSVKSLDDLKKRAKELSNLEAY
jgi:hypothetical protein